MESTLEKMKGIEATERFQQLYVELMTVLKIIIDEHVLRWVGSTRGAIGVVEDVAHGLAAWIYMEEQKRREAMDG